MAGVFFLGNWRWNLFRIHFSGLPSRVVDWMAGDYGVGGPSSYHLFGEADAKLADIFQTGKLGNVTGIMGDSSFRGNRFFSNPPCCCFGFAVDRGQPSPEDNYGYTLYFNNDTRFFDYERGKSDSHVELINDDPYVIGFRNLGRKPDE